MKYIWNPKAILIAVVVIIIMFLIPTPKANASEIPENAVYPTCGVVVSVKGNKVTFADFEGRMFVFYADDFDEGDRVAVIMADNGTETTVEDDIVMDVRYCGWVY